MKIITTKEENEEKTIINTVYTEKAVIEKFEKVKEKIDNCEHFKYDSDHFGINLWDVRNILDKQINEIKGDSK